MVCLDGFSGLLMRHEMKMDENHWFPFTAAVGGVGREGKAVKGTILSHATCSI